MNLYECGKFSLLKYAEIIIDFYLSPNGQANYKKWSNSGIAAKPKQFKFCAPYFRTKSKADEFICILAMRKKTR